MMTSLTSQWCMLQRSTELLHCQMIQLTKKRLWHQSLTQLSTIIPAPVDNSDEPLQFQVSLLDYNDFVGRIGIGRVFRGTVKVGDQVTLSKLDGTTKNFRVTKLFGFFGLERREIQEAKAGDLIAVSGMEDIFVGETITPTDAVEALPILHIDEPTLQMTFLVNNSPCW